MKKQNKQRSQCEENDCLLADKPAIYAPSLQSPKVNYRSLKWDH